MSVVNFEIFLTFPHILRSSVISRLATCEAFRKCFEGSGTFFSRARTAAFVLTLTPKISQLVSIK